MSQKNFFLSVSRINRFQRPPSLRFKIAQKELKSHFQHAFPDLQSGGVHRSSCDYFLLISHNKLLCLPNFSFGENIQFLVQGPPKSPK